MNSDQTNEFSKGKRPKLLQASDPAVLLQIFGDRKTPHLANPPVWKLEHNRRKAEKLEKLLSLKPVSKNAIKAASPNTR